MGGSQGGGIIGSRKSGGGYTPYLIARQYFVGHRIKAGPFFNIHIPIGPEIVIIPVCANIIGMVGRMRRSAGEGSGIADNAPFPCDTETVAGLLAGKDPRGQEKQDEKQIHK